MAYRIAINGFGRIGRSILRALYESTDYPSLQIVAINDLANIETLAHLTRYDSTHGRFLGTVEVEKASGDLLVSGDRIAVSQISDLSALPWRGLAVDLVMECSGAFTDRAQAECHLQAGARRVLFSQPAESDVDATLVYGINHELVRRGQHRLKRVLHHQLHRAGAEGAGSILWGALRGHHNHSFGDE